MSVDADTVRRVVFRLLEEDEEFRYAVAAKLGLAEILDEIRRIWRKNGTTRPEIQRDTSRIKRT